MPKRPAALGDNPLFNNEEKKRPLRTPGNLKEQKSDAKVEPLEETDSIITDERIEEVKRTLSDMKHEVKKFEKKKREQNDDFQRMTFIVRKDLLDKFRDFCYTERLSQKDGLEVILSEFLKNKKNLIEHPERPKQVHERTTP